MSFRDRMVTRLRVVEDLDIWRAAKLMVDQYGADAVFQAAMRADARLDAGDLNGQAVWKRILRAIESLLAERPEPGEQMH